MTPTFDSATGGNVVLAAQLDSRHGRRTTLTLGFGATQDAAVAEARASAQSSFGAVAAAYRAGWSAYDAELNPPAAPKGISSAARKEIANAYWVSANVLKASEDKTFPGAIVASLASPGGKPSVPATQL